MQTTQTAESQPEISQPKAPSATQPKNSSGGSQWQNFSTIRRNGAVVGFEPGKIAIAMTKAFLAVNGGQGAASARVRQLVEDLTAQVVNALVRNRPGGGTFHIEDIQDQVELSLMRSGEHDVARAYVLYREKRSQERARSAPEQAATERTALMSPMAVFCVRWTWLIYARPSPKLALACPSTSTPTPSFGKPSRICTKASPSTKSTSRPFFRLAPWSKPTGIQPGNRRPAAAHHPQGSPGRRSRSVRHDSRLRRILSRFIKVGIENGLLDGKLAQFDLPKLANALKAERDQQFNYLGLQTLYDRYFLHVRGRRIELPQVFFMRVAMGLALNEINREERAIQFYEILSSFDFMSSTPTLFNAGTLHSQLSSCYLTTVSDDLVGIYDAIKENALLAKYAGGLGNDWTPVRALRSHIKGTNGESQGVVPFLKVVNDTAVAVNQGGKRKGAVCAYLETWHLDIEEFLELRKNTGDERRRTHDMNTSNWIPTCS